MAETSTQIPVLDPTQTTGYPQIPPYEALVQHHRQEAPAPYVAEEWSVADQARILHEEIYAFQNGVPDVDMFNAAQEFMSHVTYDPKAQDPSDPLHDQRGVYYDHEGKKLDANLIEDIMHAGNPEAWVQSNTHIDVLNRAGNVLLANDADITEHIPTLELARQIASRTAEDAEWVDVETLRRLVALDEIAVKQISKKRGGQARLNQLAEEHEAYIHESFPVEAGVGVASADRVPQLTIGESATDRSERVSNTGELVVADSGNAAHRATARVRTEYQQREADANDTDILMGLVNNAHVNTADDIAAVLYPEKVIGGGANYGAARWRNVAQFGQNQYRGMGNLSEAERAEVMGFARQLAVARRFETDVPEQFRRHNELPTHQQLAAELFPDVEKLTPQHWTVINNSMDRLRAIRLEQVRPDRLVAVEMAAGRAGRHYNRAVERARYWGDRARVAITDTREALRRDTLKSRLARVALRGAEVAGQGYRAAGDAVAYAREAVRPLNLRDRAARMAGTVAARAGRVRETLQNVDWRDLGLHLSVRVHEMAVESVQRLNSYVADRLEASRQRDNTERNFRIAGVVAGLAVVSAIAVREYLRAHHNVDIPSASGHDFHRNVTENLPTGNGSNTSHAATEGMGTPSTSGNTNAANTAHPVVEVGSFDGSKKIMGYPKGSVGYRVLENAREHGVEIHSRGQANRLIDATLKMDHMSWTDKVGQNQKVTLLSQEQMQQLLKR
jgi:hypothetical protein